MKLFQVVLSKTLVSDELLNYEVVSRDAYGAISRAIKEANNEFPTEFNDISVKNVVGLTYKRRVVS